MEKLTQEELERLRKEVLHLNWRLLISSTDETPPDWIEALNKHFGVFAEPPHIIADDGVTELSDRPCLRCKEPLIGSLVDQLFGTGGFKWGLVHGEGYCANCGWPARAHHYVKTASGEQICVLHNLPLQYHPDGIELRKKT